MTSRDGRQIYLTQFTRTVNKPWENTAHVKFGEAARGSAHPVDTWYPTGDDSGRQFIYN